MDNRAFYSVFISFFAGTFLASYVRIGAGFALAILILGVCFLLWKKKSLLFFVCLLFFCIGAYRLEFSRTDVHELDRSIGTEVVVSGFVNGEPEEKETKQRFRFKPDDSEDQIMVSALLYPKFTYGDALEVQGTLEFPENFESYPGGPEFDYISYLEKDGVRYLIGRAKVRSLNEDRGNPLITFLIWIKQKFMGNIERLMPEPHSSLVSGILLGEKGSLPESLRDDFRRSGLTHILVLSGSNVSVVAATLMTICSFLPRVLGQSLGASSIILFALMTGASATTIRASIMALVVIMTRRVGRDYNVSRALIIAGFFMLLENPRILAFDIGFQLSFLATMALIYVSPIVIEKLSWVTEKFQFREILSTTISTQIFVLPFMLYSMGEISIISLVTNILVLPSVPWSMFTGFLTGLVGFGGAIALPFAWITDIMLSWMILVVSYFGQLPFAAMRLSIGEPLLVLTYVLYVCFIYRWHRKNSSLPSAN